MGISTDRVQVSRLAHQILMIEDKLICVAAQFKLKLLRAPSGVERSLGEAELQKLEQLKTNLQTSLTVLEKCANEDIDPWNDSEFFRIFMREVGVIYPKDFLSRIEEGDIIEGYDLNHLQIFRNMRFMEISGYSLIDLLLSDWNSLYERPNAISEQIFAACAKVVGGNHTLPFDVPEHFIREVRSEDQHVYRIKFKLISPLFSGPNKLAGILGNSSIKLLRSRRAEDNLNFI